MNLQLGLESCPAQRTWAKPTKYKIVLEMFYICPQVSGPLGHMESPQTLRRPRHRVHPDTWNVNGSWWERSSEPSVTWIKARCLLDYYSLDGAEFLAEVWTGLGGKNHQGEDEEKQGDLRPLAQFQSVALEGPKTSELVFVNSLNTVPYKWKIFEQCTYLINVNSLNTTL